MRKVTVLIAVVLLSVAGCKQDAEDKHLTKKNVKQVQKEGQLSENRKELLMAYIMRTGLQSALAGGDVEEALDSTLTIGEAITQQEEWKRQDSLRKAKEEEEARRAAAKRKAELDKLRRTVVVTPLSKNFREVDYDEYIVVTMAFANKAEKEVSGFKGTLRMKDMFGDSIANLEIKYDKTIAPGERTIDQSIYGYNQFLERDKNLRFTDLDKMDYEWEPEMIIFADGTRQNITPAP